MASECSADDTENKPKELSEEEIEGFRLAFSLFDKGIFEYFQLQYWKESNLKNFNRIKTKPKKKDGDGKCLWIIENQLFFSFKLEFIFISF